MRSSCNATDDHEFQPGVSQFVEGAALFPPGSLPARGRTEIGKALASLFPVIQDPKLVAGEVQPPGSGHAVEIGHSEYQSVAQDGKRTPTADNYAVVWRKAAAGAWYS